MADQITEEVEAPLEQAQHQQLPVAPQVVSGADQVASVLQQLPAPVVVRVVDRLGNPIAGRTVSFAVVSGGGSVGTPTATSSATGLATTTWTLGPSTTVVQRLSVSVAWYSRFLRSSMRDTLNEDYVRTARAKGLSQRTVHFRHAFRNALLPLVALIALDLPTVFGGAGFIETIFAWPGMGRLFWDAARGRDYPVLLAVLMIYGVFTLLFNLIADIFYGLLDPRIRYD